MSWPIPVYEILFTAVGLVLAFSYGVLTRNKDGISKLDVQIAKTFYFLTMALPIVFLLGFRWDQLPTVYSYIWPHETALIGLFMCVLVFLLASVLLSVCLSNILRRQWVILFPMLILLLVLLCERVLNDHIIAPAFGAAFVMGYRFAKEEVVGKYDNDPYFWAFALSGLFCLYYRMLDEASSYAKIWLTVSMTPLVFFLGAMLNAVITHSHKSAMLKNVVRP